MHDDAYIPFRKNASPEEIADLDQTITRTQDRLLEAQRAVDRALASTPPDRATALQNASAVDANLREADKARRELVVLEQLRADRGGFDDAAQRLIELLHDDCPRFARSGTSLCFYATDSRQQELIERCAGIVGGLEILRPAKFPSAGLVALYVIPKLIHRTKRN